MKKYLILLILIPGAFLGCKKQNQDALFELLDSSETGIIFSNDIRNSENFNIFNYRNFYNGGGVAVGDINNDNLPDVLLTSNMGENKLFLNKGNMRFEDISQKAGITQKGKWNTGVVMVDINQDGWLDIYICNAGIDKFKNKEGNALFINNKDLTFSEKAREYGLDDKGYTTHAAFFDYDMDGDLDCYILNNSFIPVNTLNYDNNRDLRAEDWPVKDFLKGGGDKLMKNENGKFVDVSKEAGIYGSLIGFGLGVTVGDVNNDNYPDIYISNDFFEKDYLYINQKNGKFSEELEQRIEHTSLASMGADMADINNDGFQEIYVTDMLPRDEMRLKTTTSFDNHYVYKLKYDKGFYNQFMQNSLQLNNQDGTYSEIANYAGVSASDWSWGALMFDADNDTKTDIYVCNGIYHDLIDQDFIDFFANEVNQKMVLSGKKEKFNDIIKQMPSRPIVNKFFHNIGDLKFADEEEKFGFTVPSFSNGAAYVDLDNDGDLDLVVNNVNQECFVYKNKTQESKTSENKNFLKIKLNGNTPNLNAIGSKICVFLPNGEKLVRIINPSRGFQSSTEYMQTIGLGKHTQVDSIKIIWPDRKVFLAKNVKSNQTLTYNQNQAKIEPETKGQLPNTIFAESNLINDFIHNEDSYEDYYSEKNIPQKLSAEGPKVAVGDVNGDKLEDIYICGAKDQAGVLYLQSGGKFVKKQEPDFEKTAFFEDTAAEFFDCDGDGDLDLFVGTGGNQEDPKANRYLSRLYKNDGKGNFSGDQQAIPYLGTNVSCVAPHDFDGDGDIDLFVGSRSMPLNYGQVPPSFFLVNNGKGYFENLKSDESETKFGLVRAAEWADVDNDNRKELIVVGDWMAPTIISLKGRKIQKITSGLESFPGFYGDVKVADFNGDGKTDLVLGNMSENSFFKGFPLKLWVGDFDKNKINDKLITRNVEGRDKPVFLKRELMEQFPFLKAQNLKHSEFAKRSIQDIFDEKKVLSGIQQTEASEFRSYVAINKGKGQFEMVLLPTQAQLSAVSAISVFDYDHDNKPDIILGGNYYGFIPQFGRLDASRGVVLKNMGQGKFQNVSNIKTGLYLKGEVKNIKTLQINGKTWLLSASNNLKPQFFKLSI
ncbi:MAG: VCBS repeat-containing protein [Cytophagaceae bacterium]|nr:VCBS repeat-containing protein [Cytophagaceae bacterium]